MLEVANLEVVYNDVVLVLRGLSIEVRDGQIVALLGANGAGKSTIVVIKAKPVFDRTGITRELKNGNIRRMTLTLMNIRKNALNS